MATIYVSDNQNLLEEAQKNGFYACCNTYTNSKSLLQLYGIARVEDNAIICKTKFNLYQSIGVSWADGSQAWAHALLKFDSPELIEEIKEWVQSQLPYLDQSNNIDLRSGGKLGLLVGDYKINVSNEIGVTKDNHYFYKINDFQGIVHLLDFIKEVSISVADCNDALLNKYNA